MNGLKKRWRVNQKRDNSDLEKKEGPWTRYVLNVANREQENGKTIYVLCRFESSIQLNKER